ncbi:hypothetical protein GDO78_002245 [Eleutherodactylus coqui]|uniref:Uncharacterized protein n=1 Tax=Eleutherodactylus coqui TaxID=57060 RepID=A0A8J6EXE9_ELECQ|nr:hypothetical protein GDO78_002245 [Eleutherodactylus coqui]
MCSQYYTKGQGYAPKIKHQCWGRKELNGSGQGYHLIQKHWIQLCWGLVGIREEETPHTGSLGQYKELNVSVHNEIHNGTLHCPQGLNGFRDGPQW